MGRVSKETIEKVENFVDSISEKDREKCNACNKTLTCIMSKGKDITGAGIGTISRFLADKINNDIGSGLYTLPAKRIIEHAFIYIACTPVYPEFFKLGMTTDSMERRLRTLQGIFIEPFKLVSIWEFPIEYISVVEKELFVWLKDYRVVLNKEWFYKKYLAETSEFIDNYKKITFPEEI